jgi:hypothetical protein
MAKRSHQPHLLERKEVTKGSETAPPVNERALRLDFIVAIAALLISALTAGALLYQTRVISREYAAAIWPYISVAATYDPNGETIEVVNDGLGPALIRSTQLSVDGKAVSSWNDYLRALAREPQIRAIFLRSRQAFISGSPVRLNITMTSIGPSTTIRGGESVTLLKLSFGEAVPVVVMQELLRHPITIDFCYCSLNGSCWTSHDTPGRNGGTDPRPLSRCGSSAAINSNTSFSAGRPSR